MRVFIYEYVCGGGIAGRPLPESLAREGWAMLASIVEDFARVEGSEVVTTLDERFAGRPLAAQWIERMPASRASQSADAERRVIERFAADCDWTLIIAPEFGGILLDRVRWVEESGGRLLGPSSSVMAIAADKLACGHMLGQAGVPAVSGRIVRIADGLPAECTFPAVFKPRDGAGSQTTFLIPNRAAASHVLREAASEGLTGDGLVQPFVPGRPASVSLLVGSAGVLPLLAGEQFLSTDGRFRYLGGRMPLPPPAATRAVRLAAKAVAAVPGLRGFVGVDLVLGSDQPELQIENCKLKIANLKSQSSNPPTDSSHAPPTSGAPWFGSAHHSPLTTHHSPSGVVIEINPRLTTSYVGLRRLARTNLAEQMVRVAAGEEIGLIEWRPGTVSFTADGRVAYSEADPGNFQR